MTKTLADLETPCVVIDIDRVEANLKRGQAQADALGVALRPHIKTHKIPRFALRQVELGAVGITVQKLGEAETMADAGLSDLFLPYNIVGAKKLDRLAALNERINLRVTADSPDTVSGYAQRFANSAKPLVVLVECDTGLGRCGVQSNVQALALARHIALSPGLEFGGLMTYPAAGKVAQSDQWLADAVALLTEAGFACPVISGGNTPDMFRLEKSVVTEIRPGTYIYFDRGQVSLGAASFEECALSVLTTIVSRPTPNRIVIDAGSKSLTSDLFGLTGFGVVMGNIGVSVTSLSEEHGVIELAEPSDAPRVGERIRIIPNHACPVSNLHDRVHLISGDEWVETIDVAARGRTD
ncbi:D-TA family PLP-dependent enzyme [Devosia algicola]|uniref:D-TA family PLP-dependent enzyme n=1 Tax=Devosia algicola TaxID=3026418 RepID=A0ABY7YLG5_9HYPH|nr:D-TA family PLP-dependent enzyme [Devosia algicola]WDR02129.1 D-TA family PLP-dependent enzyme [Devosia algicola]